MLRKAEEQRPNFHSQNQQRNTVRKWWGAKICSKEIPKPRRSERPSR